MPTVEFLRQPEQLKPLMLFQRQLCNEIEKCARPRAGERGMASLPTGAGKTRVAIEAIMNVQARRGGLILWIATTDEVCEQAALTYRKVYESQPRDFLGQIHRFWGGHCLDEDFLEGFMVAGIQKLSSAVQKGTITRFFKNALSMVVFDEAHHAIARTYKATVDEIIGDRKVPLVGLTATPGRGLDPDGVETRRLAKLFDSNLLIPKSLGKDPFSKLTKAGVLSSVTWKVKGTGKVIKLTSREKSYLKKFKLFSPDLLERIGTMKDRNDLIRLAVTQDSQRIPTLVFACSVAHAEYLAVMWRRCKNPIKAQAITAETHITDRRRWIEDFKNGKIQVLVNYGVLTTGFDAPNVRRIIAARPTTSPVLFEQMIGRGLRGPKFGGTSNCIIVDIADQFDIHGAPEGFGRWEGDWLGGGRP